MPNSRLQSDVFFKKNLIHIVQALLLFMVLRFKHVAVLPSCMLAIPAAFYIVLFAGGWSLDEARGTWGVGWLSAPEVGGWRCWML